MALNDPDMQRFLSDLQDSGPGERWRKAWHEMQRCVRTIRDIDRQTLPNLRDAHLLVMQRRYIAASNRASEALDELSLVFNWPPDATAEVRFKWNPLPAGPRSRKAL